MVDYLCDYREFIRNAKTDEEKHAIIWSISNLVPLKQFQPGELKIIYYEHLCTQPELELPEIFTSIGQRYDATAMDKINRPSQTTRESSAVVNGKDQISYWKQKLTPLQIDNILRVVEKFGLDDLYNDSFLPVSKDAA